MPAPRMAIRVCNIRPSVWLELGMVRQEWSLRRERQLGGASPGLPLSPFFHAAPERPGCLLQPTGLGPGCRISPGSVSSIKLTEHRATSSNVSAPWVADNLLAEAGTEAIMVTPRVFPLCPRGCLCDHLVTAIGMAVAPPVLASLARVFSSTRWELPLSRGPDIPVQ